jgi:hypothetical protein
MHPTVLARFHFCFGPNALPFRPEPSTPAEIEQMQVSDALDFLNKIDQASRSLREEIGNKDALSSEYLKRVRTLKHEADDLCKYFHCEGKKKKQNK